MVKVEMFIAGVMLGIVSSLLPSLPESAECWQDAEKRPFVIIPYTLTLILVAYILLVKD